MNSETWGLLLPVASLIHTAEEYWSFDEFRQAFLPSQDQKFQKRSVFAGALIIITLFIAAIALSNYLVGGKILQFLTTLIALALQLNAIQHLFLSSCKGKIVPGTLSAVLVVIPSCLLYLMQLKNEIHYTTFDIILWSILAAILMYATIQISLRLGYLIKPL